LRRTANVVEQRRRVSRRRFTAITCAGATEDQRARAVRPGAIEQLAGALTVGDDRRAEPAVERGRQGELEPRVDLELVGECARAGADGGVGAQELVDGGELAPDAGRVSARGLPPELRLPDSLERSLQSLVSLDPHGLRRLQDGVEARNFGHGRLSLALELVELARKLGLAIALELGERLLESCDPPCRVRIRGLRGELCLRRGERAARARETAVGRLRGVLDGLDPVADSLAG
jgi:hypothetical protein